MVFSHKNTFKNHSFGDTEDSHFLFYFGIMTVLSMMFYLALYNKKKVSVQYLKLYFMMNLLHHIMYKYILIYLHK